MKSLVQQVRKLDPSRPVACANAAGTPGEAPAAALADVLLLHRSYGWRLEPGSLAAAERAWEEDLRAWAGEGKPIIVTGYGADSYPGLHNVVPAPWSEEYQVAVLELNHRVFDRCDAVVGEHVWTFADLATPPGRRRAGGSRAGVFTRDRQPKAAAHALRRRWRQER